MRLAEKVAIITGAGSGIGYGAAMMFAREGAKLVIADIDDAGGKKTVADITSSGGEAVFIRTDVSVASDVENVINGTMKAFGRIDILFNNAGIAQRPVSVENLDEALWDRIFAVNVKGIFLMAKYTVPVMKKAGKGAIINLASMSGIRPRQGSAAYASSKAAVIHLTKTLALELASDNIRVNCINPVAVETPMFAQLTPEGKDLKEVLRGLIETIPLGRIATAEDIAYAAVYLASDEATMLTGICINVDGGRGI
jgi:3-oxoacyl-[acyl-carrier protein] reductase